MQSVSFHEAEVCIEVNAPLKEPTSSGGSDPEYVNSHYENYGKRRSRRMCVYMIEGLLALRANHGHYPFSAAKRARGSLARTRRNTKSRAERQS